MILSAHSSNGGPHIARPEPLTTRRMLKSLRKQLHRVAFETLPQDQRTVRKVHRLRVGTRKALAALTVCEPLLSKADARRIKKSLKAKRKALGLVRDWDVLISRVLCSPADEKADTRCDLLLYVAGERKRAWRDARKAWSSASGCACDWIDKKQKTAFRASAAGETTHELFRRALRKPLETIRQGIPGGSGQGAIDMELLHQFRIACKALRYLLEFRDGLTLPPSDLSAPSPARELLAEFQQRLGALHDLARRPELLQSGRDAKSKGVRNWLQAARERAESRLSEELHRYLGWQSGVNIEAAFRDLDQ